MERKLVNYNKFHVKIIFNNLTISPRPSMEKWPVFCKLGNINLPGNESLGTSLPPFKCKRFVTIPTGLSAVFVATRT